MLTRTRPSCVTVRAEKQNKVSIFRKKVETKRSTMLKDNINKLTLIASADTKFLSDTFTELDVMHKKFFEDTFGSKKTTVSEETVVSTEEDTNIFRE